MDCDGNNKTSLVDNPELSNFIQFLHKYNLKETEEHLKKELNKTLGIDKDDEAAFYYETYETLHQFVETSQKEFRHELAQILYPVFLHFYLELVNKNQSKLASEFFDKFSKLQVAYHVNDLKQLKLITNKDQMDKSEFKDTISAGKYNIKLCEDSYRQLKDFVKVHEFKRLVEIIKNNMLLEIYNGQPRDVKQQMLYVGGILGETNSNSNTDTMLYGLLKDPDMQIQIDDTDETMEEESEKPKKKKNKKDNTMNKKNRADPHAPPTNRVPLPEPREIDRINKQQALKDFVKRARLAPDKLPSTCFYTFLNTYSTVNCCDISDDSTYLALGLSDSTIKVYTLAGNKKLMLMKPFHELENLDKESYDVFNLMFDDSSASDSKILVGHSGPIFSVSFSPDKYNLVSGSEDATIRLWCLLTYSCLVCYKGHNGPVWDVKFGPFNHYFASCGADRSARLWAIDQYQSLRIYADHLCDVDCLCFHPNCNYIATGCSDRSIRILDIASQKDNHVVRHLTGHKDSINVLKFSNCGRFLASGGHDATVILWDIATSVIIAQFDSHKDAIYSLDFSRDNTVLASGGLDNTVKVYYIAKLTKEIEQTEDPQAYAVKHDPSMEICSFRTKQTPVINLHFTRRNLLVGMGPLINDKE